MRLLADNKPECYRSGDMPAKIADPWRLTEALQGNEDAWRTLVTEFSGSIWHWARSHGLTREEAEDVAQTVWYKLKDKGHTIDDPARLPGWLATTTKREAISVLRRRSRQLDESIDDLHDQVIDLRTPTAEQWVTTDEATRALVEAYHGLSAACRELLALCWTESLNYEDIALTLGKSIGYIGPTRRRCLDTLRARAGLT